MNDKTFGCVSNAIRLRSGRYLDLKDPKPDQFAFSDIAGALSKICRFGAQSIKFYSVAEHSVHCYQRSFALGGSAPANKVALLHDASEAFLGDVVKPLKNMLLNYERIEAKVERVIFDKYGIPAFGRQNVMDEHVKPIDRDMVIWEKRFLFDTSGEPLWEGEAFVPPCPIEFQCYGYEDAEFWFTYCAEQAGIEVSK